MRILVVEGDLHGREKANGDWGSKLDVENAISETFSKHEIRYCYRHIHTEMKAQGHIINHKKYSESWMNWALIVRNKSY